MIVTKPRADTELATANCTSSELVGDLVYISGPKSGSDYTVRKADVSNFTKMPAVATIVQKLGPTRAVVQFAGETVVYSGLSPGRLYWVSDTGTPSLNPPTPSVGERRYWQSMGLAVSSDRIRLNFDMALKTAVGG